MGVFEVVVSVVILYLLASTNGQQHNSITTMKSRGSTSRGRDFVIGFTSHLGNRVGKLLIQVVAFSDNTTTVMISSRHQVRGTYYQTTFDIPSQGFRQTEIPYDFLLQRSSRRSDKVLRVTASKDVAVYGIHLVPYTTDAFIALPSCQLGVHYVANSLRMDRKYSSHSLLAVIGLESDTNVQIALTAKVTFARKSYYSGDLLTFVVGTNEIVQIRANENGGDLSGTIIRSERPVAAFSGHECALTRGSSCDIISDQLIPVDRWGTTHIFTATGRQNDVSLYKILASFDNTIISVPGFEDRTLHAGDLWEVELRGSGAIHSNLPSKVDQIFRTISGSRVDPSIIQVPSENQFDFVFGFTTLPKSRREGSGFSNFVNIVVKSGECNTVTTNSEYLQCDNTAEPVPGTDYVVVTKKLPKQEALYIIQQNSSLATYPISVIVYGYERYETYGFAAGLSLQNKVLPTMYISVNDQVVFNRIYVAEQNEVDITCHAIGARPATNLEWKIDGLRQSQVAFEISQTLNDCNLDVFNTSLTLPYLADEEEETVTCIGTLDTETEEGTAQNVSLRLMAYVIPKLVLVINGYKNLKQVINVTKYGTINASCHALHGRPEVNLTWLINSKRVNIHEKQIEMSFEKIRGDNNTTETFSNLIFSSEVHQGNITCVMTSVTGREIQLHGNYIIIDDGLKSTWIIICLVVASVAFPILIYILFCRNKTESRKITVNRNCSRLQLPEIPYATNLPDSDYVDDLDGEDDNYLKTRESLKRSRLFFEKDMCLIYNMKMGQIYNRWMGTVATSCDTKKCVVLTTLSAIVSITHDIHWDKFVKRVLDLPDSMNLTRTEGITTGKGCLYLVHEHLVCESLDVRINKKQETKCSDNYVLPVKDVVKYLLGILEGMELIHSYGFLHPGLSSKKVLLTSEGVCKLYDFCLAEDAQRTVAIMKSGTSTFSVNQFAPEALLRNEYHQGSDVWSTAVVIWEILSGVITACLSAGIIIALSAHLFINYVYLF